MVVLNGFPSFLQGTCRYVNLNKRSGNKTTRKKKKILIQTMAHLKSGIVNKFGGIGPENKLFSIFLHDEKLTSLTIKYIF